VRLHALTIGLALGACGDDASHVSLPHVRSHGGRVLDELNLVTITYPDDPLAGLAERFDDAVPGSPWLRAVGEEYGVRGGRHLAAYRMRDPAPPGLTGDDVGRIAPDLIASGLPGPTEHGVPILYVIYLPATAPIDGQCTGWLAYHSWTGDVPYAVIPECYPPGSVTNRTSSASHEIIEAATDPFGDGWYLDSDDPLDPFHYYPAEVADLCTRSEAVEGDFVYEGSWSNAQADAWTVAPCQPSTELFRTVMSSPDRVIEAAAGDTVTWDLEGWAAGPTAAWPLYARHGWAGNDLGANDAFAETARFSAPAIAAGDHVTITATVPPAASGSIVSINVWSGTTWTMLVVRVR
jgi:hypothetical protein